jgi:hypothetical protein
MQPLGYDSQVDKFIYAIGTLTLMVCAFFAFIKWLAAWAFSIFGL